MNEFDLRLEKPSMGKAYDNLETQIKQMEKFKDRIKPKDVDNLVKLFKEFDEWYFRAKIEVEL